MSSFSRLPLNFTSYVQALAKTNFSDYHRWLASPLPLQLSSQQVKSLQQMGNALMSWHAAADQLYLRSNHENSTTFPWVAQILNRGKPLWLQQLAQTTSLDLPQIIRPDCLFVNQKPHILEVETAVGGIGWLQFLQQLYTEQHPVIHGKKALRQHMLNILPPNSSIVYNKESSSYLADLQWLQKSIDYPLNFINCDQQNIDLTSKSYRFVECFEWQRIPQVQDWAKSDNAMPSWKPHLEEKMWLALWQLPSLQNYWQQNMRHTHYQYLQQAIPPTTILDPTPIPPHSVHPHTHVNDWQEMLNWSQQQRQCVLKISGFHPRCWGGKGVVVGHDLPKTQWQQCCRQALASFNNNPWVLQPFLSADIIEHPYFEPKTGTIQTMNGRARISPYYIRTAINKADLIGVLVTITPIDKKKIHGMQDAILTVAASI